MNIKKEIINKNVIDISLIKKQLIIDDEYIDDNELLMFYCDSAISYLENIIHADIYQKNNTLKLESYNGKDLYILDVPVISVNEISINDEIITNYKMDDSNFHDFKITFENILENSSIIIKYKTGYETIPTPIIHCILLLVSDSYENRTLEYNEKSKLAILNKINPYIRNYY